MEELARLADLIASRPGVSSTELRDAMRRAGLSSITTADVERVLTAPAAGFRSTTDRERRWWTPGHSAEIVDSPVGEDPPLVEGLSWAPPEGSALRGPVPEPLPPLYAWQSAALQAWRAGGHRGVIEAVTGAGKTMIGVAAAIEELGRGGQVGVVVPTRELAGQWINLLRRRLPTGTAIGLLGDGAQDGLGDRDVIVAVVNSARTADLSPRRPGGLFIADECHRYGSEHNRLVLREGFARRLGLSATFARTDDAHETLLKPYLGPVCYRLGYAAARAGRVIAAFDVTLLGVEFTVDERATYADLTRQMSKALAELTARGLLPPGGGAGFVNAIAVLARTDDAVGVAARLYLRAMQDRRRLLDDAAAKVEALAALTPALRASNRSLIFTQSVDAAENAAVFLGHSGVRAAAVHSGLTTNDRRGRMTAFRDGSLQVVCAPQVLDEGVDVPEADLAVVLGASRSRRQMVQRMGRVLRLKADGRPARFVIVSVRNTVEDPACSAHESFLDEVLPVARQIRTLALEDALVDGLFLQ